MNIDEVSKGGSPHYKLVKKYYPRKCEKMEEEGVLNVCPYGWLLIKACIYVGAEAFWRIFKWPLIVCGCLTFVLSQFTLLYFPGTWSIKGSAAHLVGLEKLSTFLHIPINCSLYHFFCGIGFMFLFVEGSALAVFLGLLIKGLADLVKDLIMTKKKDQSEKHPSVLSFLWKWAGLIKKKTCMRLKIVD